jgi:hypothetical protein
VDVNLCNIRQIRYNMAVDHSIGMLKVTIA